KPLTDVRTYMFVDDASDQVTQGAVVLGEDAVEGEQVERGRAGSHTGRVTAASECEYPGMDGCAVLQRRPQRAGHAVLEVVTALPLHHVRKQVTVERGVLGQHPVEPDLPFGRDELVQAHGAGRDLGPLLRGQAVVRVRLAVLDLFEDHVWPSPARHV